MENKTCYKTLKAFTWLSIFCVNFTGLRDAQIAGKTFFLGMSVRAFLEEIGIWIGRLVKKSVFTNAGERPPFFRGTQ